MHGVYVILHRLEVDGAHCLHYTTETRLEVDGARCLRYTTETRLEEDGDQSLRYATETSLEEDGAHGSPPQVFPVTRDLAQLARPINQSGCVIDGRFFGEGLKSYILLLELILISKDRFLLSGPEFQIKQIPQANYH